MSSETENAYNNSNLSWTQKEIKEEKKHQEKYNKKYKKAILKAKRKKEKQDIKNVINKYGLVVEKKKKFDLSTTTKQLMAFIIINCTVIEIYAMIVMYIFQDLSTLDALVSAVVAETISFMIYCVKSYFETKTEMSHKLEVDKFNYECQSNSTSDDTDYEEDFEEECDDEDLEEEN